MKKYEALKMDVAIWNDEDIVRTSPTNTLKQENENDNFFGIPSGSGQLFS